MIPSGPQNPRLQGVRRTTAAPAEAGAPRTVVAVEPLEYFAVAFHDENGRFQRAVVLRMAGKLYMPPGSVEWAKTIKAAAPWLEEAVNRMAGQRVEASLDPTTLPKEDETEVLPGGGEDQGENEQTGEDGPSPLEGGEDENQTTA